MSQRTENPSERRGSEQLHQAERGGSTNPDTPRKDDPNPGHTPTKAEGDVSDVEQALEKQK